MERVRYAMPNAHFTAEASSIAADNLRVSGERIAIIGAGATGVYTLAAIIQAGVASEIVVYENGDVAGPGLAYRDGLNDPHALSNIAGIEIPPLVETLNGWASRQPFSRLDAWGIADSALNERAFFPRVVLGAWLADQFNFIVKQSAHPVVLHLRSRVVDVVALPDRCRIEWFSDDDRAMKQDEFDRVIVASGYGPVAANHDGAAHITGKLAGSSAADQSAVHTAVLGSSLSGIDAVVNIAMAQGEFAEQDGALAYTPHTPWQATMFSRNGLLPEADFWFPHPLADLNYFTPENASEVVRGMDGDLDELFALFLKALRSCAPDWVQSLSLDQTTADDFAERYFAPRRASEPWDHARSNLADVRKWQANHRTPPWKIAILRAHEVFATVVPTLSQNDLARFHRGLKRVFTDNYAAVPHLSIERILALHDAGVLDVVALGNDYDIVPQGSSGWRVRSARWSGHVDDLIDARGPQAAALNRFPFPTLRMQLCANAMEEGDDWKTGLNPSDDFTVGDHNGPFSRVHLCALPFLLRNRPFVQGIVECAQMAKAVALSICEAQTTTDRHTSSDDDLLRLLDKPSVILSDGAILSLPDFRAAEM